MTPRSRIRDERYIAVARLRARGMVAMALQIPLSATSTDHAFKIVRVHLDWHEGEDRIGGIDWAVSMNVLEDWSGRDLKAAWLQHLEKHGAPAWLIR